MLDHASDFRCCELDFPPKRELQSRIALDRLVPRSCYRYQDRIACFFFPVEGNTFSSRRPSAPACLHGCSVEKSDLIGKNHGRYIERRRSTDPIAL